jgi:alkanesulfonate monooxygenase SsuD/methylene tetrahydromethanopterin reductase-like flavin-dependent oxidoreductase (luciferase family)
VTSAPSPAVPAPGSRAATRRIRTGIVLPTFQQTADLALDVAARAEEAGVDGVFCYDHVWPLGQPERPALAPFPVLGLVAASTAQLRIGTLVARIGLVPEAVLLSQFDALATVAPGRVIAGIGTGDRLSAGENEAYGVPFAPAEARLDALRACVRAVVGRGVPTWVGGGSRATRAVAAEEGAALNVWDAPTDVVAAESVRVEVTWAGPPPPSGGLGPMVARLADAGATWAVLPWPVDPDELAAAGAGAGMGSSGGAASAGPTEGHATGR